MARRCAAFKDKYPRWHNTWGIRCIIKATEQELKKQLLSRRRLDFDVQKSVGHSEPATCDHDMERSAVELENQAGRNLLYVKVLTDQSADLGYLILAAPSG
ncbi:hypothetical protein T10_2072 [Trichinella papuae]|uniref:Uncharacterized protein n=1 Tax=Trichinella papuae TaxID=268474 RepID=A0A0V1MIZ7_9BILA|nr:hypothetical protein T10_2072 [Trichinella papuae]